jgi:hypothetical protein
MSGTEKQTEVVSCLFEKWLAQGKDRDRAKRPVFRNQHQHQRAPKIAPCVKWPNGQMVKWRRHVKNAEMQSRPVLCSVCAALRKEGKRKEGKKERKKQRASTKYGVEKMTKSKKERTKDEKEKIIINKHRSRSWILE